ncbi:MAG: hypothetical protein ACTHK6_12285 [Solirubrobacterales bacterium]
MSILDDAIREHLELKRAHGADETELKRLEDEAFGPPGRPDEPDPAAEAPTEFLATPEAATAVEPAPEEGGRRRINIADLQEPPPAEPPAPQEEPRIEVAEASEAAEAEDAPPLPAEDAAQAAPPAEEEPVAMEHEIVAEPAESAEPKPPAEPEPPADERQAIAEQPTELFDVEAEMGTEDVPAPVEAPSPSDEEIVAAEQEEPRLAPVADEEEEDEEFWSEQRLSDELDQALEAPITDEHEEPAPTAEPSPPVFDHEEEDDEDEESERPDYDPDTGHEDVLEDTPDFLEDAPEDDELWFEQRPPKDFDFDD